MPCRATQDGWVMVENSEKMCSSGETEVFSHVQPFANPWTTSVLCLWEFAGKNTGVDCNFFSRGSSQPRDQTRVSWTVSRLFTIWATREAHNGMKRMCGNIEWNAVCAHMCVWNWVWYFSGGHASYVGFNWSIKFVIKVLLICKPRFHNMGSGLRVAWLCG